MRYPKFKVLQICKKKKKYITKFTKFSYIIFSKTKFEQIHPKTPKYWDFQIFTVTGATKVHTLGMLSLTII